MQYRILLLFVALSVSCTSAHRKEPAFVVESIPKQPIKNGSPKTCNISLPNKINIVFLLEGESREPYSRESFMGLNKGRSWGDEDRDCKDTRAEVLEKKSLITPVMSKNKCSIRMGLWHDPYTDTMFEDASDLDIDHIIPLKEAHESGANKWSADQRGLFANDYQDARNLIPVWNSVNRSKGAKDPAEWLPPNETYHCEYIRRWASIKSYWKLSVDQKECSAIQNTVNACDKLN